MKVIANCATCGAHLVGEKLNRIGSNFYCQSDYSKKLERDATREVEESNRKFKRLLTPFNNLVTLDFENDWTLTNVTASGKELTTTGNSLVYYTTEMAFGSQYKLQTRISADTDEEIIIKNTNTDASINQNIQDGVFVSVGKIIMVYGTFTIGAVITIEQLTLVET